jgi:hypothetical protein
MNVDNSPYGAETGGGARRSGKAGAFLLFYAVILPLLSGCDSFSNSMVEYFLDHTETVEIAEVEETEHVRVLADGTVLIPPPDEVSPVVVDVALANPRDFSVGLKYPASTGGAGFSVTQPDSGRLSITITGAKEGETYAFPLIMKSPDGLRDFPAALKLQCVSFDMGLQNLMVNGVTPPDFAPNRYSCAVVVPFETESLTLSGTTVHLGAALTVFFGGSPLTPISTHTVTAALSAPLPGGSYRYPDNPVIFTVTAPNMVDSENYFVNVYRRQNDSRNIVAFNVTSPVTAVGLIDEDTHTITLPVPAGTNLSNMTTSITHTGASISPASGTARNFSSPQTYTVTAMNGETQAYTVTAILGAGIIVSGAVDETEINFTGVPLTIAPGQPITVLIPGQTVTSWYIEVTGGGTPITSTTNAFTAPGAPGFYTVNVIAVIDGVPYSGSFPLTVE